MKVTLFIVFLETLVQAWFDHNKEQINIENQLAEWKLAVPSSISVVLNLNNKLTASWLKYLTGVNVEQKDPRRATVS